jgi:hypothetical protein
VPQLVRTRRKRGRTGPNQRHLTTQDVDELGELIKARLPQQPPHTSDPRIVNDLEVGPRHDAQVLQRWFQLFGVPHHSAELIHLEPHPVATSSQLCEEHRAWCVQPDRERDQREERHEHRQSDETDGEVERALEGEIHAMADGMRGQLASAARGKASSQLQARAGHDSAPQAICLVGVVATPDPRHAGAGVSRALSSAEIVRPSVGKTAVRTLPGRQRPGSSSAIRANACAAWIWSHSGSKT